MVTHVTPTCANPPPQGTNAAAKNELLFSQFGINYAHLPEQFKKVGTGQRTGTQTCPGTAWVAHTMRICTA